MLLKHKQTVYAIKDIIVNGNNKGITYTYHVTRLKDGMATSLSIFIASVPTDIAEINSKGETLRYNFVVATLNQMLMAQANYFESMKAEGYFSESFIPKSELPVFNLTNFNVYASSLANTNNISRNVVNVEGSNL